MSSSNAHNHAILQCIRISKSLFNIERIPRHCQYDVQRRLQLLVIGCDTENGECSMKIKPLTAQFTVHRAYFSNSLQGIAIH